MKITKVSLEPLQKTYELEKFRASDCVFCGFLDNMFQMTFRISDNVEKEVMQDLAIDFSNVHKPKIYLSKPYVYDNAESEW